MKLIRKVEHLEEPEKQQTEVLFFSCALYKVFSFSHVSNILTVHMVCIFFVSNNKGQVLRLKQHVFLFMARLCLDKHQLQTELKISLHHKNLLI